MLALCAFSAVIILVLAGLAGFLESPTTQGVLFLLIAAPVLIWRDELPDAFAYERQGIERNYFGDKKSLATAEQLKSLAEACKSTSLVIDTKLLAQMTTYAVLSKAQNCHEETTLAGEALAKVDRQLAREKELANSPITKLRVPGTQ